MAIEAELLELESALWKSETRYNLEFQERTFAPDFFEFGRSGRRYTRSELIRTSTSPIRARFPLQEFNVAHIEANTYLVTYVSEALFETLERANRCSLWTKTDKGWQLRFHQGTPL